MADIKFVYDVLSAHSDSNYRNKTFHTSITTDRPSMVKLACSDASHQFDIVLDEKLLYDEHSGDIKMEKLLPKYKCEIYMKASGSGVWLKIMTCLLMRVQRFTTGQRRKKFIKLSGTDWATGIMKKRVMRNLAFTGDPFGSESGVGIQSNAKVVGQAIVDKTNAIGSAGITFSAGTLLDSPNNVAWPSIARDFSNRTAFDSMRALAKEIGADFWSDENAEITLAGWMSIDSGKNYTDDDLATLDFTESAEVQSDNIYSGPGTMRVYPLERIDKWMNTDQWRRVGVFNGSGSNGEIVVSANQQGPDGTSVVRMTATNVPALGLSNGVAKIFQMRPNATSANTGTSGDDPTDETAFDLPINAANTLNPDGQSVLSALKMIRFYCQIQKTDGTPLSNNDIIGNVFRIHLVDFSTGSYRFFGSRDLAFSRDNPPLVKWYDLSLEGAGTGSGDFPTKSSTAPTKIQMVEFYIGSQYTRSWLWDIGQFHAVYEATQKDEASPVSGTPLFEGINLDPSGLAPTDSLTMAERAAVMTRANDLSGRMILLNEDLDWGTTKFPGMTLDLQSDSLEVPDESPSTQEKMRVEVVEHQFKEHTITTTIRCAKVPMTGNAAQESKVVNMLDTLLGYDETSTFSTNVPN